MAVSLSFQNFTFKIGKRERATSTRSVLSFIMIRLRIVRVLFANSNFCIFHSALGHCKRRKPTRWGFIAFIILFLLKTFYWMFRKSQTSSIFEATLAHKARIDAIAPLKSKFFDPVNSSPTIQCMAMAYTHHAWDTYEGLDTDKYLIFRFHCFSANLLWIWA